MQQFTTKYGKLVLAALLVSFAAACTSPLEPKTYEDDGPACTFINGIFICR
jgi:hypothetical protein